MSSALRKLSSAPALAALLLAGCAELPTVGGSEVFETRQRAAAEYAAANGELAAALAHWRSLATLNPDDDGVAAEIAALEKEIDRRAEQAVARGVAAYRRGDRRGGDAAMLEALALKPGLDAALEPLRTSASGASHARQEKKLQAEYARRSPADKTSEEDTQAEVEDALAILEQALALGEFDRVLAATAGGSGDDLRDLAHRAQLGLADRARGNGDRDAELAHLTEALALTNAGDRKLRRREAALRKNLSDEAFREGLALLQSDLEGAIALLEEAMRYNPENLAAKQKLDQAVRLQDNLKRIRGG